MDLPGYLQIEPVGQCNLQCPMCAIQFRKTGRAHGPPAFMPMDDFTRIVDQFAGLEHLHLQGLGEPMMHPQFFEMVGYAVGRGVRVTTNTNLTVLNPRRAERCITSGLDCLHVSIDGATAATYERIRIGGRFDRVLRNLAFLRDARQRLDCARPRMHMVVVLMRQNLDELPELVRLAHCWNIQQMFVQHLCHDFAESTLPIHYHPMRQFVDDQMLEGEDPQRIEARFQEARQTAEELKVDLRLPNLKPKRHPSGTPGPDRCNWPWQGAYVSYDGHAMPCCMIGTPDRTNLGNLRDASAETVWNGEAYQAFRRRLASDDPPEICRGCSVYHGTF